MATNKVFVSPGVYTSERDLSFVSQNVGVTTLGIVGETLKGPAFEPIFITNYDEYQEYFGGTNPEKFVNTQIPKYEASYIAKSYLQQSNQLFVTRILGLSGYDAGPSWSIVTIANVDKSTIGLDKTCEQIGNITAGTCDVNCTANTLDFTFTFSGCDSNISTIELLSNLPDEIQNKLLQQYTHSNGSTSSLDNDIKVQLSNIFNNPSLSATSINYWGSVESEDYNTLSSTFTDETNIYSIPDISLSGNNLNSVLNDPWYYSLFDNYSGESYSGFSFYTTISDLSEVIPPGYGNVIVTKTSDILTYTGVGQVINYSINVENVGNTPVSGDVTDNLTLSSDTFNLGVGDSESFSFEYTITTDDFTGATQVNNQVIVEWEDLTFGETGITSASAVVVKYDPCNPITPPSSQTPQTSEIPTCFSGTVTGKLYYYTGLTHEEYNNMVVGTLRSRGTTTYTATNAGPEYQVTGLTDVSLNMSGSYAGVGKNPYLPFEINITDKSGESYIFKTSFQTSEPTYISKVFGLTNFGKSRSEVPLFLEERYQNLLDYGYNKGYIRGLRSELISLPSAREATDTTSIAYYLEQYQTPESPWVVSEIRGNKVTRLFKAISIADGNSANRQVKISIANISFTNQTFDVLVRDYFDTDSGVVLLEKFTNCSMNPSLPSYIGKRIGTSDGTYESVSKYIMLELNEDAPIDSLPCGFEGYMFRDYEGAKSPFPVYKTKYSFPGEVVFTPPFGEIRESGDNVRKTYLGISSASRYGYDPSLYEYYGKRFTPSLCDATPGNWFFKSKGFHMDIGATAVTITNEFINSGETAFETGIAEFRTEPTTESNPYYRGYARKFTFLVQGGFDGWDIYTEKRTNDDRFKIGSTGYLYGACPDAQYDTATGWGAFKRITIGDNTQDYANTDYYAYLIAQKTFENPEAVNINVFTTPGIDYVNNQGLVRDAIEMIETDRADSIYITTTPDFDLLLPSANDMNNFIYPQESINLLEDSGIDSNYTATYYPWVLTKDSVNNTQIYLPPTAEVCRNLALTDNISFPWFAAAGYSRGLVNAVKTRKKLTQEDRDILYGGRINPIATFSDVGPVIWGNKTLQSAESALDRLNVRRLLLRARKLISAVSVRLLFEQNDQKVRQDFLDAVNPILDGIRRDRGLYDFRVTVSSSPEDLDRNQLVGKIYIKPTRSLEFIDIEFLITPTGASFEDI